MKTLKKICKGHESEFNIIGGLFKSTESNDKSKRKISDKDIVLVEEWNEYAMDEYGMDDVEIEDSMYYDLTNDELKYPSFLEYLIEGDVYRDVNNGKLKKKSVKSIISFLKKNEGDIRLKV